jgi:hypothetical protein
MVAAMPWWIWLIPVAGLGVFVVFHMARPAYHRGIPFSGLQPLVRRFVAEGRDEAIMVMEQEGHPGLLQLRLGNAVETGRTVEFGLPFVDWSSDRFDRVAETLRNANFLQQTERTGSCGSVRRFLRVSCVGPIHQLGDRGWEMLTIAANALEWESATLFTVHYETPVGTRAMDLLRGLIRGRRVHLK